MKSLNNFKDTILNSLSNMWSDISQFFLKGIGVILFLIIGWIIIKLIIKALKKVLKLIKINKFNDKINDIEIVEGKKLNFDLVKIISTFIKWVLYIVLLIMVSDLMGLEVISNQIGKLLSYLPQLFVALVIFTLGLLFANFAKKSLKSFFDSMDLSGGKIISQTVFFIILTFVSITALNQAGIDTSIITNNITLILAAFLLAFALALGLGAKEVVGKLFKAYYARKTFEIGQRIILNNKEYEIKLVENLSIKLVSEKENLIVPINDIVEHQIEYFIDDEEE